jgi:hypothetical protein
VTHVVYTASSGMILYEWWWLSGILTVLQISQITEFMYQYRKHWKEHIERISCDRIPKIILKYQPRGKINLGRPLRRWKDSVL